jgi:lipoprotein-releasing system permease protein
MLRLDVGDEFPMFFFDEKPRPRRFKVAGLFETSLEEFDKQFILTDIKHIQRLYGWDPDQISGFEIMIDDYNVIDRTTEKIRDLAAYRFMDDGSRLKVINIKEKYPQIFQWLNLLDMNVVVILLLMVIVAIVNMISGLIILILDRTSTIGLLKAIGSNNHTVKRIFLYQSFFLIVKGLLLGNLIAIIICLVQEKYQILKLDQASYFIDYVPINMSFAIYFLTNLGSLLFILLAMYLPALIILRIDPVKTLRYE